MRNLRTHSAEWALLIGGAVQRPLCGHPGAAVTRMGGENLRAASRTCVAIGLSRGDAAVIKLHAAGRVVIENRTLAGVVRDKPLRSPGRRSPPIVVPAIRLSWRPAGSRPVPAGERRERTSDDITDAAPSLASSRRRRFNVNDSGSRVTLITPPTRPSQTASGDATISTPNRAAMFEAQHGEQGDRQGSPRGQDQTELREE